MAIGNDVQGAGADMIGDGHHDRGRIIDMDQIQPAVRIGCECRTAAEIVEARQASRTVDPRQPQRGAGAEPVAEEKGLGLEEDAPRLAVGMGGRCLVDDLAIDAPPDASGADEDHAGPAGKRREEAAEPPDMDVAVALSGRAIETDRPDDRVDLRQRREGDGGGDVGDDRLHPSGGEPRHPGRRPNHPPDLRPAGQPTPSEPFAEIATADDETARR